ncbi:hypothetical protein [Kitasatospora sp. NPDC093558]
MTDTESIARCSEEPERDLSRLHGAHANRVVTLGKTALTVA